MNIEQIKAVVDAARERQMRNNEWAGTQWQQADIALIALWEMVQGQEASDATEI